MLSRHRFPSLPDRPMQVRAIGLVAPPLKLRSEPTPSMPQAAVRYTQATDTEGTLRDRKRVCHWARVLSLGAPPPRNGHSPISGCVTYPRSCDSRGKPDILHLQDRWCRSARVRVTRDPPQPLSLCDDGGNRQAHGALNFPREGRTTFSVRASLIYQPDLSEWRGVIRSASRAPAPTRQPRSAIQMQLSRARFPWSTCVTSFPLTFTSSGSHLLHGAL